MIWATTMWTIDMAFVGRMNPVRNQPANKATAAMVSMVWRGERDRNRAVLRARERPVLEGIAR
jgi:hypothetical protein